MKQQRITELSRSIPLSLASLSALSIAAETAETLPVKSRYDLPHIPLARRSSISSTKEVFAAASAATIAVAAEKLSITPSASTPSGCVAP